MLVSQITPPPAMHIVTPETRNMAVRWMTYEFNKNFKGKVAPAAPQPNGPPDTPDGPPHRKHRQTSTANFFADSDESSDEAGAGTPAAAQDELAAYLALPQVSMKEVSDPLQWWREHTELYPNVAVMARQYLGCPASSAAVERLFSQVGIAWSAKRKRGQAGTIEDIIFAHMNLP